MKSEYAERDTDSESKYFSNVAVSPSSAAWLIASIDAPGSAAALNRVTPAIVRPMQPSRPRPTMARMIHSQVFFFFGGAAGAGA